MIASGPVGNPDPNYEIHFDMTPLQADPSFLMKVKEIHRLMTDAKSQKPEPPAVARTAVGAQIPAAEISKLDSPRCKTHRVRMKYNADEDQMECPEDGCERVAKKRRTFRDTMNADVNSQPVVYRGELEFIYDETGEMYLFLRGANAVVSLAGIYAAHQPAEGTEIRDQVNLFMGTVQGMKELADNAIAQKKHRETMRKDADEASRRMRERASYMVGGMQIYGVPLPPHLCNVNMAAEIRQTLDTMPPTNRYADVEDRVASAIEIAYPSRTTKHRGQRLEYYTANGKLLDVRVEYYPNRDEELDSDLLRACMRSITELEEEYEMEPEEVPIYVMIDGLALTKLGCKKLLHGVAPRNSRREKYRTGAS